MKYRSALIVVVLSTAVLALSFWLVFSNWILHLRESSHAQQGGLDSVEATLNDVYRDSRPFPYRWLGAPFSTPSGIEVQQSRLEEILADIERIEFSDGRSARTLMLRARTQLLAGHYNEAISSYRSSLLLEDDAASRLELGVAFALRASTGSSALDYEFALEAILQAAQKAPGPESRYDTALLLERIPLPHQAISQWESVTRLEPLPAWRHEAENRIDVLRERLKSRQQIKEILTASPDSYLLHAPDSRKSVEVILDTALEDWLPGLFTSSSTKLALTTLADTLRRDYQDLWLRDLIAAPPSKASALALVALSEALKANAKGEHIRAEALALRAEQLFSQLHNHAGMLRARLERVYSLDRRERAMDCIKELEGLRSAANESSYIWIEGQTWLEEITCYAETRRVDVASSREQAYEWVSRTGYEGLRLRALSFLTEAYASFNRRLQIWRDGLAGLNSFWSAPLPPLRGYTFYYTLARSAESAGDSYAAIWLLREGTQLLNDSSHRHVLALVLSDLGAWEGQEGLRDEAEQTFSRMDIIFKQLNPAECQKFFREAEITHAEAELADGQPQKALLRLQNLTLNETFPYRNLSMTARRRLLVLLGNIYLVVGDLTHASAAYIQVISESENELELVKSRSQRDNTLREIEPAWRGLTEVYLRRGDPVEALSLWEDFRCGRVSLWKWHPKSVHNTLLSARLKGETAFLVYAFLPGGLSSWFVDGRGTVQSWMDGKAVLREVHLFSNLVADSESPLTTVSASSRRLYMRLFRPFADRLPNQGVLVVDAEGSLAGIPWEALEDQTGKPLVERLAVSQVSGWIEISHRSHPEAIQISPLIIGQPKLGAELEQQFPSLPGPEAAAIHLHRALPHSVFFDGPAANADTFVHHLPTATLLYFAGHGIGYGEFGGLLLAPAKGIQESARLLTADQIINLNLSQLQLVVLAACSSGAGEQAGSVNLDSLVRAFIESGAGSVIAARWNVSSDQTGDLIDRFYRLALRHITPSEALRQAELETRRTYAHPYYWAGFQLFGAP